MIGDTPSILNAAHTHSIYGLGDLANPIQNFGTAYQGLAAGQGLAVPASQFQLLKHQQQQVQPHPKMKETPMSRRFVQVFIADPDDNIPMEKSLLYSGSQKLTDAIDQELFFEIDLRTILDAHNTLRVATVNKKVKERVEYLEPARIRDLKMVVVTIATF